MKQLDTNKFISLALNALLENPNTPMSVKEIWKYADNKNWIKELDSKALNPIQILGACLYMDYKNLFERVSSNPTKFIKKGDKYDLNEQDEVSCVSKENKREYNKIEQKLHPKLAKFIYTNFLAFPKTICHETSRNKIKGEGKWLHPDMVAVRFPFTTWDNRALTTELSKELGCFPLKFLSFELKQQLKSATSEFKESFFQAVSNSSWANEGYIVAPEIDDDPIFLAELKRLSTLYGIGVIKLDVKNPENSIILYPAIVKDNVDLTTIDKLSKKNKDFESFIKQALADSNKKDFKVDLSFYDEEIE